MDQTKWKFFILFAGLSEESPWEYNGIENVHGWAEGETMKKVLRFIIDRRHFFSLIALVGLSVSVLYIYGQARNVKKVATLQEGVQTCFSRVGQSFIAGILGRGPEYLVSDFFKETEECFGVANSELTESIPMAVGLSDKLNAYALDVHWFHNILNETSTEGGKENVFTNFEKLEVANETVLDGLSNLLELRSRGIVVGGVLLAAFIMILLSIGVLDMLRQRKMGVLRNQLEKDAGEQIVKSDTMEKLRVRELIKSALENNHLYNCSHLFSEYIQEVHQNLKALPWKTAEEKKQSEITISTPTAKVVKNTISIPIIEETPEGIALLERTIENLKFDLDENEEPPKGFVKKTVNAASVREEDVRLSDRGLTPVRCEEALTESVDALSAKIFAKGVMVDLETPEDLWIWADKEALVQVFCNTLSNAIESAGSVEQFRRVHVKALGIGNNVVFEIADNGKGFTAPMMVASTDEEKTKFYSSGMRIVWEFMRDFGGALDLTNKLSATNEIIGSKIRLEFKRAKKESARELSKVVKTTKREFVKAVTGNPTT